MSHWNFMVGLDFLLSISVDASRLHVVNVKD
jgi:hypothetical protein